MVLTSKLNQKSKSDDSILLYKVTWRCLAVPELPKALLAQDSASYIFILIKYTRSITSSGLIK